MLHCVYHHCVFPWNANIAQIMFFCPHKQANLLSLSSIGKVVSKEKVARTNQVKTPNSGQTEDLKIKRSKKEKKKSRFPNFTAMPQFWELRKTQMVFLDIQT